MYPMMPGSWGIATAIDPDLEKTALLPTADFVDAVWAVSRRAPGWAGPIGAMANTCAMAIREDPATAFARAKGDRREVEPVRLVSLDPIPRYSLAEAVETMQSDADFVEKVASQRYPLRTAFVRGPRFTPAAGIVREVRETPNTARIELETAGPSFLMMSVTPHKYWRVDVDGKPVEAMVTNIGFQGVTIPAAGKHIVEMRYRNPLFAAGGAISVVTLAALLLAARRSARK
jgi:hypothetical protein